MAVAKNKTRIVLDDLDDDDDDNIIQESSSRIKPPRPSAVRKSNAANLLRSNGKSRRRRSSARFLTLSRPARLNLDDSENEDPQERVGEEEAELAASSTNLQELYKKAIQMNNENKINANNSWSLKLIENLDNFLEDDVDVEEGEEDPEMEEPTAEPTPRKARRVNFTKASCTLDASVKIYSYRVDDVHLTSYKVLANLNRNSNTKDSKQSEEYADTPVDVPHDDSSDVMEPAQSSKRNKKAISNNNSTLETNLGEFRSQYLSLLKAQDDSNGLLSLIHNSELKSQQA